MYPSPFKTIIASYCSAYKTIRKPICFAIKYIRIIISLFALKNMRSRGSTGKAGGRRCGTGEAERSNSFVSYKEKVCYTICVL